jgi:hypothetical protein
MMRRLSGVHIGLVSKKTRKLDVLRTAWNVKRRSVSLAKLQIQMLLA